MSHSPRVVGSYLDRLLHPSERNEIIVRCIADIQRSGVEFEAIAFTGVSGALIAPILAQALTKSLIVVRKKDDYSSHSDYRIEGDAAAERYIIADDIVDSGKTVFTIVTALSGWKDRCTYENEEEKYISSVEERKCVGVIASKPYSSSQEFEYQEWIGGTGTGVVYARSSIKYHRYRNLGYRVED